MSFSSTSKLSEQINFRPISLDVIVACALALLCSCIAQAAEQYRIETIIGPGPFHGLHGLALGPDNAIYAGDIVGMSVHRIDPKNGSHRRIVGPPTGMADDVAFAPPGTPFAGTMVWSGVFTGRVYARAADGGVRLVADGWPGVNTVAFSPDGTLYATQLGPFAKALWRVDLSGAGKHVKLLGADGAFNGFVITRDDVLYGPRADLGGIVRMDLHTLKQTVIADGFRWPTAVKTDSKGMLYVVDFEAGDLWRVNPHSGEKTLLAAIEPGLDNLTIDPDDRIFVSSVTRNGIFEINRSTGRVSSVVAGALIAPGGVSVLDGVEPRVFLADMFALREVDGSKGTIINLTVPSKAGPFPTAVRAYREDGAVRLMYTSWFTGDLSVIDADTRQLIRYERGFAAPRDSIRLNDGSLVVAESGAGRITRVSLDGARRSVGPEFVTPVGLALDRGGRLLVTDATAGVLTAVDLVSGKAVELANGLGRPEGIAVSSQGGIFVVDSASHRILCVDPSNGRVSLLTDVIALGLEGSDPLPRAWVHNGIAVTSDGILYVPSDLNAALYRLVPNTSKAASSGKVC